MKPEQIWECIKEVDWEKIQREMPEGISVTTLSGRKIPLKPKDEKQKFWNYLCLLEDRCHCLDKIDITTDAMFPNYRFDNRN